MAVLGAVIFMEIMIGMCFEQPFLQMLCYGRPPFLWKLWFPHVGFLTYNLMLSEDCARAMP